MSNKLKVLGMPVDEGWRNAPAVREPATEQPGPTGEAHPPAAMLETKFKVEKKKPTKRKQ